MDSNSSRTARESFNRLVERKIESIAAIEEDICNLMTDAEEAFKALISKDQSVDENNFKKRAKDYLMRLGNIANSLRRQLYDLEKAQIPINPLFKEFGLRSVTAPEKVIALHHTLESLARSDAK